MADRWRPEQVMLMESTWGCDGASWFQSLSIVMLMTELMQNSSLNSQWAMRSLLHSNWIQDRWRHQQFREHCFRSTDVYTNQENLDKLKATVSNEA